MWAQKPRSHSYTHGQAHRHPYSLPRSRLLPTEQWQEGVIAVTAAGKDAEFGDCRISALIPKRVRCF